MSKSANLAWHILLDKIMSRGEDIAPRGLATKELLGQKSEVLMTSPVVVSKSRALGYKFMCAEAAWILSGDNRVETITQYSKTIHRYSDDGVFFYGAYGPRIRDQLRHVLQALTNDPNTRQAVVTIWRPNPPVTKDVPCTISCQFMLRGHKLDCFMNMRSSDAWLGVPYDWFNFSVLAGVVALLLRQQTGVTYELGTLHFYAASQHIYQECYDKVIEARTKAFDKSFESPVFDHNIFDGAEDLIEHLWHLARGEYDACQYDFLVKEMRGRNAAK